MILIETMWWIIVALFEMLVIGVLTTCVALFIAFILNAISSLLVAMVEKIATLFSKDDE